MASVKTPFRTSVPPTVTSGKETLALTQTWMPAVRTFLYYQKRAHNALLPAAGFDNINVRIPWLGNRHLRLIFG